MRINLYIILFTLSIIYGQFPIELNIDQSYSDTIVINQDGEYLLNITCSSNTSWEENQNESSILSIFIDGAHNQDIIIFNGSENHTYKQATGFLEQGNHIIEFLFDYRYL